jgi:adenylate cyclase
VSVDWAAEGLLDGLEGEARAARAELLTALHDQGEPLERLRVAVAERRLAMIPVERVLRGEGEHSMREVAEMLGLELERALDVRRALALPMPDDPDAPVLTKAELDLARQGRALLDAGVPAESFIELTRVMSQAMGTVAAAFASEWSEWMSQAGDTERDLGLRYAESLRALGPTAGPALENMFMLRLREQVRQAVVDQAQLASGELPGAQPVVVGFADMVGFTSLGEQLPPEELGAVVRGFDRLVDA